MTSKVMLMSEVYRDVNVVEGALVEDKDKGVDVVEETLDEDVDVVQVLHQVNVQVMMKLQYPSFQHSQDIEAAHDRQASN